MARRSKTADQILRAALHRFNAQGYATTTLAEIAASIDISQGNLTYHFPTKRHLVTGIQELVAIDIAERRTTPRPEAIEDQYLDHLQLLMDMTARYRFLLRDDAQIEPGPDHQTPHRVLVDGHAALRRLLGAVDDHGLFRSDLEVDLDTLGRALWVLERFWMEYLNEMELRTEIGWPDQRRGIEHHFAVLLPNLTADGRRRFTAALNRATDQATATESERAL